MGFLYEGALVYSNGSLGNIDKMERKFIARKEKLEDRSCLQKKIKQSAWWF